MMKTSAEVTVSTEIISTQNLSGLRVNGRKFDDSETAKKLTGKKIYRNTKSAGIILQRINPVVFLK